jgi:post-segregation antitoxin (ccd killing protein)
MWHSLGMSTMIQVRNVSARVHKELMRRAKKRGLTLTRYIEEILESEVSTLTMDEWLDRVQSRKRVKLRESASDSVRKAREERDAELASRELAPRRRRSA